MTSRLPSPPPLLSPVCSSPSAETGRRGAAREEVEDYLAGTRVEALLVRALERLMLDRPENPYEYLIQFIIDAHPNETKRFGERIQLPASTSRTTHDARGAVAPSSSHKTTTNIKSPHNNVRNEILSKLITAEESDENEAHNRIVDGNRRETDDDDDQAQNIVADTPAAPQGPAAPGGATGASGRRGSISAAPLSKEEMSRPWIVHPKPADELKAVVEVLSSNWLTSALHPDQIARVADALEPVTFQRGERIITQGEERAEHYFIVKTGAVTILADGKEIRRCLPGEGFGELALMYNKPRCASVVAEEVTTAYRLDRVTFKKIVIQSAMQRREKYRNFLASVPLFEAAGLSERDRLTLADALQSRVVGPGQEIVRQGDKGDSFFLIVKGRAEVIHEGEVVDALGEGDYFGEIALLSETGTRATTVRATEGDSLEVAFLSRDAFRRLLGSFAGEMKKRIPHYKRAERRE